MTKTVTHRNEKPFFGKEDLLEIASKRSFASMIFEALSGSKPSVHEEKIFETILNISIDHGAETPSAIETIARAKEGKLITQAVAAGILQINDYHGGAIEPAMELLYKVKRDKLQVTSLVREYISLDRRIPGFGHRIYKVDPRSKLLFALTKKEKLSQEFINLANEIQKELSGAKRRELPVNIDGAIAAILCTFGWNPALGKAVFVIARAPGLSAQYLAAKGF